MSKMERQYKIPEGVTEEMLVELRARTAVGLAADDEIPPFMKALPGIVEMATAGNWLGDTLRASGCPQDEREQMLFSHGQICFPNRDPWVVASIILRAWHEKEAPKPGAELAAQLLTGDVSELPPGGMRIVAVAVTVTGD